jgi:hypothetical protein
MSAVVRRATRLSGTFAVLTGGCAMTTCISDRCNARAVLARPAPRRAPENLRCAVPALVVRSSEKYGLPI